MAWLRADELGFSHYPIMRGLYFSPRLISQTPMKQIFIITLVISPSTISRFFYYVNHQANISLPSTTPYDSIKRNKKAKFSLPLPAPLVNPF